MKGFSEIVGVKFADHEVVFVFINQATAMLVQLLCMCLHTEKTSLPLPLHQSRLCRFIHSANEAHSAPCGPRGKQPAAERWLLSRGAECAHRRGRLRAAAAAAHRGLQSHGQEENAHHLLKETDIPAGGDF